MMEYNSFIEALERIIRFDSEVVSSVAVSLITSISAISIISPCALVLALYLGLSQHKHAIHKGISYLLDAFLAMPTVLLGLLGYILFSHQGILSYLTLLYTPVGMTVILALLAFPLLTSLLTTAIEEAEKSIVLTAYTLGASRIQAIYTLLWEQRNYIITAYITVFTRLVSEVGIAMMVGGNIKYHTRTITTTIALETGKGNFSLGIALGLLLLCLSSMLTITIRVLQRTK